MKRVFHFVVMIVYCWALGACSINKQTPLTKVAQHMEGNWINEEYLETLRLTKSPQQADNASAIKVVQIRMDSFKQLVLSFQEGDDWMLDRDEDGLFFSSIFDYTLQLKTKLISNQKLQVGDKVFLRFSEDLDVWNKDIMLVQKTLFSGSYDWNGKLVEFYKDGTIKGMERVGVKTYYPIVYYNNNQEMDQIWLNKGITNSVKYGFEFQKKKLYIYQLKCPDQEVFCGNKSQRGAVLFELDKR
jgi:hypothetical protein